jgi:hypothetical protein
MATYVKFNQFVEDLAHGVHDFSSDQCVVALTNTAPTAASDATLSDITEISYTNLSTRNLTTSTSAESSGTYTLLFADLTLTASGSVGPFRYVVIYNDTPTSPADPLIAYYDYGSSITMSSSETLLIDFTTSTFTVS